MDYLEEEDIHFCLRCRRTILGLDSYVTHRRQNNCRQESADSKSESVVSKSGDNPSDNGSIGRFIEISTTHVTANISEVSDEVQGQIQAVNSDTDPSLKADDFFSLLELQSSSKSGASYPTGVTDSLVRDQKSRNVQSGIGVVTRSKSQSSGTKSKGKYSSQAVKGRKQITQFRGRNKKESNIKSSKISEKDVVIPQKTPTEVIPVVYDKENDNSEEKLENSREEDSRTSSQRLLSPSPGLFSDLPNSDRETSTLSPSTMTPSEKVIPFQNSPEDVEDHREEEDDEEEDEELYGPPRSYGGKWKPGSSPSIHQQRSVSLASVPWNEQENNSMSIASGSGSLWKAQPSTRTDLQRNKQLASQKHVSIPPPGHTRGKWIPFGNDLSTLRKAGSRVQYWCGVCNRRLSSRGLYERHLMSPLHAKRTRQERQLDEDLHETTRRPRRLTRKLQETIASKRGSTSGGGPPKQDRKKGRKSVVCEICESRVLRHQMGKHLVSRFHCKRAEGHPDAQALISANAAAVAREAPFRCGLCRFYCNSLDSLLFHWDSDMHTERDEQVSGRYWCSFCKYFDDTSAGMRVHLLSREHQEVVSVINKSVPIEIQKLVTLKCDEPSCDRIFRFNYQLRQHSRLSGHKQSTGSASDSYQNRSKCNLCSYMANSERRLQEHMANRHKIRNFFCSDCGLRFASKEDAIVHRRSKQHKYTVLRKRRDPTQLKRSCPHCFEVMSDVLALKEHLHQKHPDKAHRCSKCGDSFTLKQELSRHVRSNCKGLSGEETGSNEAPIVSSDITGSTSTTTDNANASPDSQCPKCSFTSTSKSELLFHIALHGEPIMSASDVEREGSQSEVPKYVCPSCPRLIRKDCLKNHIKTHTGEKPHACDECGAAFARADVLSKHRRLVHRQETRCHLCGLVYSRLSSLRRHLESHEESREKNFHCAECGSASYDNKIHYMLHFEQTSPSLQKNLQLSVVNERTMLFV